MSVDMDNKTIISTKGGYTKSREEIWEEITDLCDLAARLNECQSDEEFEELKKLSDEKLNNTGGW